MTFRPQVAILDIGLPVMDGYTLGRELRARLGDAPPILIALTGYGQAQDRRAARRRGSLPSREAGRGRDADADPQRARRSLTRQSTTTTCAWILPSTAPPPNRLAISAVAASVASSSRDASRASISLRSGVP